MALDIPKDTPDCGEGILITSIFLIILIIIFTVLRVVSKFVTHQDWWWDDFFALLALVCILQSTENILRVSDYIILRSRSS